MRLSENKLAVFLFVCLFNPVVCFGQELKTIPIIEILQNESIFTDAPFAQCHASSLAELEDGSIMAVWFGGTYERHPDVCIWGAVKKNDGWSRPEILADGIINDSLRYPCWNPVLFKNNNKELILFYKVGPSPEEWWGMQKKSFDAGKSWSPAEKLPPGFLGPIKNKPVSLPGGRIISPSSTEKGNKWNVHFEISDDDCKSWYKVNADTSTGFKIIQPTLLTLSDKIIIALMRSNQNCIVSSVSIDAGLNWSKPKQTLVKNPNSGIDAVSLKNGKHLLVYNPAQAGKEWYEGRSKLFLAISDDGENWPNLYKFEDNTKGEYSYPAIIQTTDGKIHLSYTSERKNIQYIMFEIKQKN